MKSKPMSALFGVLALVAIVTLAPQAFAATVSVHMTKGAGAGQDCVTAKNCFDPQVVNINPGDTVTWTNDDTVSHTTTSGQPSDNQTGTIWDSSLVKPGATFSFTFQNPGTYNYFCMVHPWMTGQVIVGSAAATSGGTTSAASSAGSAVPEFGSIAPVVLVIAVISIVVLTAKTRGIPKL